MFILCKDIISNNRDIDHKMAKLLTHLKKYKSDQIYKDLINYNKCIMILFIIIVIIY